MRGLSLGACPSKYLDRRWKLRDKEIIKRNLEELNQQLELNINQHRSVLDSNKLEMERKKPSWNVSRNFEILF